MDAGIYGLGAAVALSAGGPGVDAAGLLARSRAHGGAGQAVGAGHYGGGQAGFFGAAGSYPRVTSVACGAIPSEDFSGKRTRRGSITKTGNAHLRRIAIEAAWSYRLRPGVGPALRKRQEGVPEEIKEIAWKAQHRLHKRYMRLAAAGKDQRKIITAVGRELLGFIWEIGIKTEAASKLRTAA